MYNRWVQSRAWEMRYYWHENITLQTCCLKLQMSVKNNYWCLSHYSQHTHPYIILIFYSVISNPRRKRKQWGYKMAIVYTVYFTLNWLITDNNKWLSDLWCYTSNQFKSHISSQFKRKICRKKDYEPVLTKKYK